ncbi:Metacaspase-1A like protein [Verticillium longisporum]|nr:Metacaspase-1A like protein [Verticillium longisporum]
MWSGSKDDQTSADATIANKATGAMSHAFISALKANPQQSYVELLNSIREILEGSYSQLPQLSSSHPMVQHEAAEVLVAAVAVAEAHAPVVAKHGQLRAAVAAEVLLARTAERVRRRDGGAALVCRAREPVERQDLGRGVEELLARRGGVHAPQRQVGEDGVRIDAEDAAGGV